MPKLSNPKHEAFAQGLYAGETQHVAYEKAGYKPSRGAASRLAADVNIATRLAELQERGARQADETVDTLCAQLDEVMAMAMGAETPQTSAAVAAIMGKAKLRGLVIDKGRLETENTTYVMRDEPLSDAEWSEQYGDGEGKAVAATTH